MATAGLLQWANTIRLTMATDPCRQLFKDQVQTHGFSFLDDYLDSILSNAKQDALIDLVKTPGRKRIAMKKLKPESRIKAGVTLFSENTDNLMIPQGATRSTFLSPQRGSPELPEHAMQVEMTRALSGTVSSLPASENVLVAEPLPAPHIDPNELSIIAEGDESAEKSCLSSPPKELRASGEGTAGAPSDVPASHRTNDQPIQEHALPSSCDPIEAPPQSSVDQIRVASGDGVQRTSGGTTRNNPSDLHGDPSPTASNSVNSTSQEVEITEKQCPVEGSIPHTNSLSDSNNTEVIDMTVPLRDSGFAPSSPKDKSNHTSYLSLPAPLPLRKSMRAVAENPTMLNSGAATPGAVVTGKRTSWLQKARQAKALEIAGKKSISLNSASLLQPSATPSLANSTKRKSAEAFNRPGGDDSGRHRKVAKTTEDDTRRNTNAHLFAEVTVDPMPQSLVSPLPSETQQVETEQLDEDGMLDQLRKAVEGLGSRTGRSTGKSLGVSMATSALADARAAAEARIAERNMKEEETITVVPYTKPEKIAVEEGSTALHMQTSTSEEQKSGQEMLQTKPNLAVPTESTSPGESTKVLQPSAAPNTTEAAHGSNRATRGMTPPGTPPNRGIFILPPGPVFNKPPPVFKPPTNRTPGVQGKIVEPTNASLGSSPKGPPLTTKSTLESVRSEIVFDNGGNAPAWMSGTQETSYTTVDVDSQNPNICDEDDSWPIDEKLSEGVQWIYGDGKDDSTTWSSLPSQHNTADLSKGAMESNAVQAQRGEMEEQAAKHSHEVVPAESGIDVGQHEIDFQNVDDSAMPNDATNTIRLIGPPRSQSQLSQSSSASSQQSQVGFFGQASKLLSSMIASGSKAKPDVKKVLQKAAVAAKKQQEESDKKAARLKEMENRRQLAMHRKAEEEKAKNVEQEKKVKEIERRKREREEHTDKRPLKAAGSRKEDDAAKKRKIEAEKKADVKIPVNSQKPIAKSALKQQPTQTPGPKAMEAKSIRSTTPLAGSSKGKGAKVLAMEEDLPPPSQIVQTQMAARAKAQLQAAKKVNEPPTVLSESIELPDINSEYSDSEDEGRPRTFDPPDWAQSPELKQALQEQSTINPDDIFGAIRPLKMEEIFKTRRSRFRARTSSANWVGTDQLTVEEEREYARRMGFK